MWSVGVDCHLRLYVICVLDENGKLVRQWKIRGGWRELLVELRELQEPFGVCVEASCGSGHLSDQLRRIARRVVVAHPGQVRLIFKTKRKNDRIDARKLATLLFLDQVPAVHVPSIDVRMWRQLIEFRHRMVGRRTQVKNALRTLLRSHGIETTPGRQLWTRKGLAWLTEVPMPARRAEVQRDLLLEELSSCQKRIKRLEQELAEIASTHGGIAVLMTIPGVGIRTAEGVVAYVDNPGRFGNTKAIGSYFGVVPCQDESAGKARFGHITREGPATVRKLLTEASWQGIRRSREIRRYYERVRRGDPKRTKIALVATAHYLARVMLTMLRTGEAWREQDLAKAA